jgi:hypothetical protein
MAGKPEATPAGCAELTTMSDGRVTGKDFRERTAA